MPSRLIIALALSLALHGVLFVPDILERQTVARPRPALEAMLRLPPELEVAPVEPLLKNTLDTEDTQPPKLLAPVEPLPIQRPGPATRKAMEREIRSMQRKLSKQLFFPAEAVMLGIEGEVHLLVTLNADGSIADASIAASSGSAVLDNAAIKAAYAMPDRFDVGVTGREVILPVVFRLQ